MAKRVDIHPVTRIEGEARVRIFLDEVGEVRETRLEFLAWRGFEKILEGRLAEDVPFLVTRICGLCPWMHHLAAVQAVEACFRVTPPAPAERLRELALLLAHFSDKIFHFYFLASPDFFPETKPTKRNIFVLAQKEPELIRRVLRAREEAQALLQVLGGKAIHPVTALPGGMSKPLSPKEREEFLEAAWRFYDLALYTLKYAKEHLFPAVEEYFDLFGDLKTGFLGMVDGKGGLTLLGERLRLMRPDGSWVEFSPEEYLQYLAEHVEPWTYGKMPYAKVWGEGFSLSLKDPRGIYRVNTLARINVADQIPTPRAQEALEEFRERFGRPAQSTFLYHWARLIELVYVTERLIQVLDDPETVSSEIRVKVSPRAGRGVGCLEAPRGTLIHDYSIDEEGRVVRANLIVGTTHNTAPMNLDVALVSQKLIRKGRWDEQIFNRIEMGLRAYDP